MKKSRFSKKLYAENDQVARNTIKHYFSKLGKTLIDYSDDVLNFNQDLIEINQQFFVECERKREWKSERWPYDSVHILARKTRLLTKGNTFLCIVSHNLDKICIISPDTLKLFIRPQWAEKVMTNRVKEGELMYNVPLDKCLFDKIIPAVTEFFGFEATDNTLKVAKALGFI